MTTELVFPDVKTGDRVPERGLAMFTGELDEWRSGERGGGVITILFVRVVHDEVRFTGLEDLSNRGWGSGDAERTAVLVALSEMLDDPRTVVDSGGAKGVGGGTVRLDDRD